MSDDKAKIDEALLGHLCKKCHGVLPAPEDWPKGTTPGEVCHSCKMKPDAFTPGVSKRHIPERPSQPGMVRYRGRTYDDGADSLHETDLAVELSHSMDRRALYSYRPTMRGRRAAAIFASFHEDGAWIHPHSALASKMTVVIDAVATAVLDRLQHEFKWSQEQRDQAEDVSISSALNRRCTGIDDKEWCGKQRAKGESYCRKHLRELKSELKKTQR